MDAQPNDGTVHQPAADAADNADVAGHSVLASIATSGVLRTRARAGDREARSKADEVLPPLTKPFPSMRDDRRR